MMMAQKVKQQKPRPAKNLNHTKPAQLAAFSDHIKELRRRVLWVALVFLVTSGVAYNFHDQLVQLVMQPLNGQKLIYLTPGGGFSFIFQITLYAGIIASAPMMSYQLYAFVRPALPLYARRSATKVVSFAVILMLAGVGYGYFLAVPAALHFLSTFAGSEVLPSLTADSYLNFFLSYVAGLGLLFQLPLLLIFWHWIKPMKPGGLLKSERFIILFAFIAAALITPTPDVVNQAMIAVPLIAIYQIGVVAVLVMISRAKRKQKIKAQPVAKVAPATAQEVKELLQAKQPQKALQPMAPATEQPRPMRTVDGFMARQSQTPPESAQSEKRGALRVPERPPQAAPLMRQRPVFRIDGMSPM
ncbi:MAG TPA: twin-arginine translocase subunit TatC [Candidatus Saccharimonadales bacterium]